MNKRLFLLLALLFLFTACGGSTTEEDAEYTYPPSSCYTYNLIGEDESAYENEVGETEQICTTELDEPEEPAPDTVSFSIEELTQRELDNLPVWLSVGLDLYLNSADARDISNAVETARQMVADGLPGFGDAWFIPGFIPDTSPRDIEMVAHAFVQHISEAGALREFVGKHTQAQYADDAITAAVNFWSDFTGAKNDSGFIIRYERGRVQTVEGAPLSPFGIVLSVRSTYAVYYFGHERDGTPEQWTWDMVSHHVAIGEESIFFVSDWFGHEPNRRFVVFNIHIDVPYGSGGGGYINRRITNFQNILDPPWAMAHEAVHAVLSTSAANIRNNFPVVNQPFPGNPGSYMIIPFFEEGMCIMLELLFEIETENERFALEAASRRRKSNFGMPVPGSGEFYDKETRLTLDCALYYINNLAIMWLSYYYEPGNTSRFGRRYTVLNMNNTAASFMFYLYTERGTRADLLRAYRNINYMYEVYGADMEGMVESWLVWLDGWR